MAKCPVCSFKATVLRDSTDAAHFYVECPRCGTFFIQDVLKEYFAANQPPWLYRLSADLRRRQHEGEVYIRGNPRDLQASLPNPTVARKLDLLLQLLAERTETPGSTANINFTTDCSAIWTKGEADTRFLISHLASRGLVALRGIIKEPPSMALEVQADGFAKLEEMNVQNRGTQAFVAMHFAESLLSAYTDGFDPAIRAAGLTPYRVDQSLHSERIDAKIILEINRSRIVIADATNNRPCVLYEAGYAYGLGKPIVWTCKKDQEKDLPFDTRQFPHILWKDPADLQNQLSVYLQFLMSKSVIST